MGGAGQWTLDHRRSLTRHRKQEEEDKEEKDRKKESKRRRYFKARPERQVGNDSNTGRKKTANMCTSVVANSKCFTTFSKL